MKTIPKSNFILDVLTLANDKYEMTNIDVLSNLETIMNILEDAEKIFSQRKMKIAEPNFDSLEEAKEAIRKAYADLVGYCVYRGDKLNAFELARNLINDECAIVKLQIERGDEE